VSDKGHRCRRFLLGNQRGKGWRDLSRPQCGWSNNV
jgi:hypothetical protein